ncbi:hypothetical protein [Kaistia sp. UC242_56]|uniref:hypothetical protein n=1 Tax=Kaistia sp. UC242_56 TaxID=3374625 RepID=UPI0037A94787
MIPHFNMEGLALAGESSLAALRRLRVEAAAEVERLIALLDAIDADVDLEPGGDDEPSLGACESHPHAWLPDEYIDQTRWSASGVDDREDEDEREDGCDAEPSLGWTASGALGSDSDCEDQDEEDEDTHDSESDPAEMGIADRDAAEDFHLEHAAIAAFRDDRAIRTTGQPVPEPSWPTCEPRQLDPHFAGLIPHTSMSSTAIIW